MSNKNVIAIQCDILEMPIKKNSLILHIVGVFYTILAIRDWLLKMQLHLLKLMVFLSLSLREQTKI